MGVGRRVFTSCAQVMARAVLRVLYGLKARGREHIPRSGPVIIASNHLSYLDPPIIGALLPRHFRFVATEELFNMGLLATIMRIFETIPIKRGAADRRAYHQIIASLRRNDLIVLFAEGTRSFDGRLQPFEPGTARIALLEGIPVVPTTITGSFEAWSRTRHFPTIGKKIIVRFHRPIFVEKITNRAQIRELTAKLCNEIAAPMRRRLEAYHRLCTRKKKSPSHPRHREERTES
jgi:1-acyl-sn-glycerol-3-phosphate acyltransferase